MLRATRTACATSNEEEDHEKLTLQRRLFNHFHPASVDVNPFSQLDEGVSSAAVMDASEDIALVELRALSSEVRTIKNKQILQETVLQTMQHVAPSPPAVISDMIMNYPTTTNTVASNSMHKCPTTTIDLQVDRGNVIHNHTEEVPVYSFQLPPFMATTDQGKNQAYINPFLPPLIKNNFLHKICLKYRDPHPHHTSM